MNKKWIVGLDSLRIILAVIVLVSHIDTYSVFHSYDNQYLRAFGFLFGNSFVGVCAVVAFFVLSGIVIHYPYANDNNINPFSFLIKRYLRVGIPMLAIYIIAKAAKIPISSLPFWSLYCELIYYTLYPFILYCLRKDKRTLWIFFLISFVISYIVVLWIGNALEDLIYKNKNLNAEYWQHGIMITSILGLPNWLLGVIIATKFNLRKHDVIISIKKIYLVRFTIFLISVLCSIGRFHFSLSYTLSLNVFGVIAAYWIWCEINYWINKTPIKILENLGKMSYSLYVCHAIPVYYISRWFNASVLVVCLEIIATFIFSYLFYIVIEKPSHRIAQKIK